MGNKNSTKPSNTSSKYNAEETSDSAKGSSALQRAGIRMVQNVLLIWLDSNIDDNNNDCQNTVAQLRRIVNDINIFSDGEKCIQFIDTINDNKVCMIISDSLGQHIVPRVHNTSQVDSIFILCSDKNYNEYWTKEWSKIKGVFTEITSIFEALKQAARQCEQNAISISFMATDDDASSKNLDRLDPTFIYTQIMKEILLTIEFQQHHIKEFTDYCRTVFAENEKELKNIDTIERNYRDKTPIWWYTYECFLNPMLNRALRMNDVDIIMKMGFFIGDLHRHIEKLYNEQFGNDQTGNIFTVYRGQGLSQIDFEQLKKTKGGLMSFNNFLSTSKDRTAPLRFSYNALADPDSVGILFVMTIDPSINGVSYFEDKENEVVFSMHTVFRIHDIKPIGDNHRLFEVDLTLTGENDKDLRMFTSYIRERCFPNVEGWYRLGSVLHKMGQFKKSQQVYEIMLEQTTDESEKGKIYCHLGTVKMDQGEYAEAIKFYEKSLEIYKKTLSPNHLNLAISYNNIGLVNDKMGEYSKALSSYEKALEIKQQALPPNHPSLAASYDNIGLVYYNMGEYSKALSYYKKDLEISEKSLHANHLHLAASNNNIGLVYFNMGEYSKALLSHEKALEIRQEALTSNHPYVAISYNNIGEVYREMGEYEKALSSHEKALEIRRQALPSNHPSLAASYNNVGLVYYNMREYSKALSSYEKALEIREGSLPPSHPDLGRDCNNIGLVYESMGNYSKARTFYERAVNIGQQSLSSNHPILLSRRNNLDSIKNKL